VNDVEFVNIYIETMKNKLVDVTLREIMAESKIALLEKQNADLQAELKKLQNKADKKAKLADGEF